MERICPKVPLCNSFIYANFLSVNIGNLTNQGFTFRVFFKPAVEKQKIGPAIPVQPAKCLKRIGRWCYPGHFSVLGHR